MRDTNGVAHSFHPLIRKYEVGEDASGDPELILVNPRIAFGKPVIRGTAISTEVVAGRLTAGDTEEELASEYGRTLEEIRAAATFEGLAVAA